MAFDAEAYAAQRTADLAARVERTLRRVVAVPLAPRRWPELSERVVPVASARARVGWKGGVYVIRLCRVKGFALGGACASCRAPIDPGDLYAPRNGSLPLCLDCVEPAD